MELDTYQNRRSLELVLDGANWSLATFGHIFVAWLLAWILWDQFSWFRPAFWAAALSLIIAYQASSPALHGDRDAAELGDAEIAKKLRHFSLTALAVGVGWAAAGLLLFPQDNTELQLFLVFVMGGMSLSAVGTQHVYLPACYASMGFAVPMLGLRYAFEGQYIEALLLLLYTAVLIRLARMLSSFSMRTVQLQFERDKLLTELSLRATDLEEARRDAVSANEAKSRFLAQASHDLRQPLHAIGLFVESIAKDKLEPRVAQVIDRVKDSLGALSSLFDSLLDVNLLDTQQTRVKNGNFKLQELFDELEREFQPLASEAGITLRFSKTKVIVACDPVLLRRMLQNLISNAIRYAPQAKVLVGVRRQGERLKISVFDTGSGISSADQSRIFEEFVRLQTRNRNAPGLGLGLSIVDRLARLLDLRLWLESIEGRGSVFSIGNLKRATNTTLSLQNQNRPGGSDPLHNIHLLVVDDDEEVLAASRALLERWGCKVTTTNTFPATIGNYDIIVSDDQLADGISGLAQLVDARERDTNLRAVLITGNSSAEIRTLAAASHFPLLQKPVKPVQLKSALLYLLSGHKVKEPD